jgi:hypothetical protein
MRRLSLQSTSQLTVTLHAKLAMKAPGEVLEEAIPPSQETTVPYHVMHFLSHLFSTSYTGNLHLTCSGPCTSLINIPPETVLGDALVVLNPSDGAEA